MHMLEYLFANSSLYGDPDRLPPGDKSSKSFLDIPMASGVAAQFVASRNAIQMRPLTWWEKLWKLNTGVDTIHHCDISISGGVAADNELLFTDLYKKGSDVASVMERIWHNFFLDRSSSSSSASAFSSQWERKDGSRKPLNALYCPDVRNHHWLSPYLTTAITKPHLVDNGNMINLNGQSRGGINGRGKSESMMMMKGKRGVEVMGMLTQNKRDERDGGSRGKLGSRGIK